MSQFSASDFNVNDYAKYRPKYTDEIYEKVKSYHKGDTELLIDVGCGPGTATFQMIDEFSKFKQIIGTDISATMLQGAKKQQELSKIPKTKLDFVQSPCNDFSFLPKGRKADMITAVECVHWFDFDKFQKVAYEHLNYNGTVAIWCYCNMGTPKYPHIADIGAKFRDSDKYLGPYWEQPGRTIFNEYFKAVKFDPKLFTDIEDVVYYSKNVGKDPAYDKMLLKMELPLKVMKHQLSTTSAYSTWKKNHPNDVDITDQMVEEVLRVYPELTEDSIIEVYLSTIFKFARKA